MLYSNSIPSGRLPSRAAFLFCLLLTLAMTAIPARAATRTWDGSSSGLWTTAANWDIATVPVNGDLLIFPPGPTRLLTTNSVGGATNFHSLTISGSNYVLVGAAPLSIMNGLTNVVAAFFLTNTVRAHLVPRASQTWVTSTKTVLVLASNVNFTNLTLTLKNDSLVQADGAINGGAGSFLLKTNNGTLEINGTASMTHLNARDGTVQVDGTLAGLLTVGAGAVLSGSGTVPAFTNFGVVAPGASAPGVLTVSGGAAVFSAGSSLSLNLLGTVPGTSHDQLKVSSPPNLSGGVPLILIGYSPLLGDSFVIITNTGAAAFTTTFSGRPEGSTQTVSSVKFRISYVGGSGNDVTLTVVGFNASGLTRTWDGGAPGADANWLTSSNWVGDLAPAGGASLVFPPGPAKLLVTNNFPAGTTFNQLLFGTNGYDLRGNALTLLGGIRATQASATVTLRVPVLFSGAQTVRVDQAAQLNVLSALTLDGLLTLEGTGDVLVQLNVAGSGGIDVGANATFFDPNSYSGVTRVLAGAVLSTGTSTSLGVASPADDTLVEAGGQLDPPFGSMAEPLRLQGRLEFSFDSDWTGPITFSGTNCFLSTFPTKTGTLSGSLIFTDAGLVRVNASGRLSIEGSCSGPERPAFAAEAGTLTVNTLLSAPMMISGGFLEGTGEVGDISSVGLFAGRLRPGLGGGVLTCSNVSFTGSSKTFVADLLAPGLQGQLRARGTVALGGPLALNVSYFPALGDVVTIIDNQSGSPVTGTFIGLTNNATLTTNGITFRINYDGGDGNDVTLTFLSLTSAPPTGVTKTWSGASTNGFWSNPSNWVGNIAPIAGDSLIFPTTQPKATNDFAPPVTFNNLDFTFGGAGFAIAGNIIVLGGQVNGSASYLFFAPVVFAGAATVVQTSGISFFSGPVQFLTGDLQLSGGSGGIIVFSNTVTGLGGVTADTLNTLRFTASNSYPGTTLIKTLTIANHPHAFGSGPIVVATNKTVRLAFNGALANSSILATGIVSVFGSVTSIITAPLTLRNGASLTAAGAADSRLILAGPIQGGDPDASINVNGGIETTGTNTFSGSFRLNSATTVFRANGQSPNLIVSGNPGTVLAGTGLVSVVVGTSLAPGNSPGVLTTSNLTLNAFSTNVFEINSVLTPGVDFDQVNVHGTVDLGNSQLRVVLGGAAPNLPLVIINNDGADAVIGTFAGLPNNSTFTTNGITFRIRYDGGDGNDVTLTREAPATGVTSTWSGLGTNNNWSNPSNWVGNVTPAAGNDLLFPASVPQLTASNDIPDFVVNRIRLAGAGYLLAGNFGNGLFLLDGIHHTSGAGANTVGFPVGLVRGQTFETTVGGSSLSVTSLVATFTTDLLTNNNGGSSMTLGAVTGPGGVVKTGAGLLIMNQSNSYAGPTLVLDGTLRLQGSATLGSTAGSTVINTNAVLSVQRSGVFAEDVQLKGTLNGAAPSGSVDWSGNISVDTGTAVLRGNTVASFVISGVISGASPLTLDGDITLLASNAYAGTATLFGNRLLVQGTFKPNLLAVGSGATLGGTGTVGVVTVFSPSYLAPGASPGRLTSSNVTLIAGANFIVELNGTAAGVGYDQLKVIGTVTLGGNLALSNNFSAPLGFPFVIIDNDGGDAVSGTFAGLAEGASVVSGGQSFRVSYVGGDGNDVTLTRFVPATGVTRVWDGGGTNGFWANPTNWVGDVAPSEGDDLQFPPGAARLINTNDFPVGRTFNAIRFSGANYSLFGNRLALGAGITATVSNQFVFIPLTLNSNVTFAASNLDAAITMNLEATIDLAGNFLTFDGPGRFDVRGVVSGNGRLVKNGPGQTILYATNTYVGSTTVNAGTLDLRSSSALGAITTANVAEGAEIFLGSIDLTVAEPLSLSGRLRTVSGATNHWSGAISVVSSNALIDVPSAGTLIIDGLIAVIVLPATNFEGVLTKTNDGVLVVNATNFFAIPMVIRGGTLEVDGSLPTSPVLLAPLASALLSGVGQVGAVTTAPGAGKNIGAGTISSATGLLGVGDLTADSGTVLHVDLNGIVAGSGYDQLAVAGSVTLGNAQLQLVSGFTPVFGDVFKIIDNDGADAVSGTFFGLPEGAFLTNGFVLLQITYTNGPSANDVALRMVGLVGTGVTRTWDGAGIGPFWSNPTNWVGDVLPQPGDDLVFPAGAVGLLGENDFAAGTIFNTLRFEQGGYIMLGNEIRLLAGLSMISPSGNNSLRFPVTLAGSQTFNNALLGGLTFEGAINLGAHTLTAGAGSTITFHTLSVLSGTGGLVKSGAGILSLDGTNTFSGPVDILAGTVRVRDSAGLGSTTSGTTVAAGARLQLANTITIAEPLSVAGEVSSQSGTNRIQGAVTLTATNVIVGGGSGSLTFDGPITETVPATLVVLGNRVVLNGTNQYTRTDAQAAFTIINGFQPGNAVLLNVGTFGGRGVVGTMTPDFSGVSVAPGESPGILTSSNIFWNGFVTYRVEVSGSAPGTGHDQLVVRGTVAIGGANLAVTNLTFLPPGTVLTIIDNDGADAVGGIFSGRPEGSLLTNNGTIYRLSYVGGDGNDVTLTRTLNAPASTIQFSGLNSNGLFTLTGAGFSNAPYVLEATPHLNPPIPWQPISTNTSGTNGVYQFIDLGSTNFPIRFYRVQSP